MKEILPKDIDTVDLSIFEAYNIYDSLKEIFDESEKKKFSTPTAYLKKAKKKKKKDGEHEEQTPPVS